MPPAASTSAEALRGLRDALSAITSATDRIRRQRDVEEAPLHEPVFASVAQMPHGVDPEVELAALRALHATLRYAQPWFAAPADRSSPTARELTTLRAAAVRAQSALTAIAASHPAVREVPQQEVATIRARAYVLARTMEHGGASDFTRPEVLFYAGLPTPGADDADGSRAVSLCVDRLGGEGGPLRPGEFSGAGGCAVVSIAGDRRELDALLTSAPSDEATPRRCLAVIASGADIRFVTNWD